MSDNSHTDVTESPVDPLTPSALKCLQDALLGLRFGQVLLVLHEGAIVQIERTERKRLTKSGDLV